MPAADDRFRRLLIRESAGGLALLLFGLLLLPVAVYFIGGRALGSYEGDGLGGFSAGSWDGWLLVTAGPGSWYCRRSCSSSPYEFSRGAGGRWPTRPADFTSGGPGDGFVSPITALVVEIR